MSTQEKQYRDFLQDPPRLGNQFLEDSALRFLIYRFGGAQTYNKAKDDLTRFGKRAHTDLYRMATAMEQNVPYLVKYNAWGELVNDIVTCHEWKGMKSVAAEEKIIALGYEEGRQMFVEHARLIQFSKLLLFGPSSGLFNCPLAMTDGATRLMELLIHHANGNTNILPAALSPLPAATKKVVENAYHHLISTKANEFWTSGQWMTEKKGGSDVAEGTTTVARKQKDGTYKLYGFKWFTSATDADMTVTLARIVDEETGQVPAGSKGLSCFLVHVRDSEHKLNSIDIQRLKNKLGTKQLPTAELELNGTVAYLLSKEGKGINLIANLINITRIYNSIAACGFMRRMIAIVRDYSARRIVFNSYLNNNNLHLEGLATLQLNYMAALSVTLELTTKLGRVENFNQKNNQPTQTAAASSSAAHVDTSIEVDETLLRLLTPLVKLYTAKQCVAICSESIESIGGQGYMEDSNIPRYARDAQVLPIWEGTTNVLSHDVLRVLSSSQGRAFVIFSKVIQSRIQHAHIVLQQYKPIFQQEITLQQAIDAAEQADKKAAAAQTSQTSSSSNSKISLFELYDDMQLGLTNMTDSLNMLSAFIMSCFKPANKTSPVASSSTPTSSSASPMNHLPIKDRLTLLEASARDISYSMSRLYMASTLLENALHTLKLFVPHKQDQPLPQTIPNLQIQLHCYAFARWLHESNSNLTSFLQGNNILSQAIKKPSVSRLVWTRLLALDLDIHGKLHGIGNLDADGNPRSRL